MAKKNSSNEKLPFFFCFSMKSSFHNCGKMKTSYAKSELFGSVCKDDFAVFNREVIEDIVQVGFSAWFFLIPDKFAIVFENEIPWSPVFQVFG